MACKTVKFSILVPVYNAEEYLDASIQSVLQQTYGNYELILVDDGSKDRSGEICDSYAQKHDNVFAYHKENAGQLHTREYAIDIATGDYYVFLDADDTLREHALETIYNKINEYNSDCVIYQWERMLNGKVVSPAPKFADICITDKRELYKKCFLTEEYNSMCRKAVNAEIFSKKADHSGDYSIRHGEDLIQSLAVLKYSRKVAFVDDVLYNYTVNPESVSQSMTYDKPEQVNLSGVQRVLTFLQDEAVWKEEDYTKLRNYYNYLICSKLLAVCKQDMPFSKKREMFEHIRNTHHYRTFLSQTKCRDIKLGKRTVMFLLFKNRQDTVLILLLQILLVLSGKTKKD